MIPDKLVTAAAATLCGLDTAPCKEHRQIADKALAAAFAALPKCEEARQWDGINSYGSVYDGWNDCLAALARMAES